MTAVSAGLGHAILNCRDVGRMVAFYVDELGVIVTDRGTLDGIEAVFMALDPTAAHHNLALIGGRDAAATETALNHLAFQLPGLAMLRQKIAAVETSGNKTDMGLVNHCISWSMYFRDPEGNRIEFYVESPFFVPQPVGDTLDMSLSDEEIVRAPEAAYRDRPGFQTMAAWKAGWQTAAAQ